MNKECPIVEDLLPLYDEALLQDETSAWLENHVQSCKNCQALVNATEVPIEAESISSTVDQDKMFAKISLKLSVFQLIFVALSFFFAMNTSVLNESYGFILSYTVLGFVSFYFYRKWSMVLTIAFVPTFLWSIVEMRYEGYSLLEWLGGSAYLSSLHVIFAVLGILVAVLLLKLQKEGA